MHAQHSASAPAPEAALSDDQHRQEEAARMAQRLNDPEWRPLAEYVRKKLGDQFALHAGEVYYLVFGRKDPCPLQASLDFTVATFLAMMSRYGPTAARRLLDAMLGSRREKRARPTDKRNETWRRWHEEQGMGPTAIARRWNEEAGDAVEPNAVKQALRRIRCAG
jgi:hypothetical protein